MADEIFPVLTNPISITEPTKQYTGYLTSITLAPRTDNKKLDLSVVVVLKPYRQLTDGTVEVAPKERWKTYTMYSLVAARAAGGTALSRFADDVMVLARAALRA